MVKNLSAVQENWVQSLDREDALEKGMATHSSILAWRIPWTEEPGGLHSMGSQEFYMTERLTHSTHEESSWRLGHLPKFTQGLSGNQDVGPLEDEREVFHTMTEAGLELIPRLSVFRGH